MNVEESVEQAAEFVRALDLPGHVQQITIDISEKVSELEELSEMGHHNMHAKTGALAYKIGTILDVIQPTLMDKYVLETIRRILEEGE